MRILTISPVFPTFSFSTRPAELRLNDNSLTGRIPNDFSNLDKLVVLNLENNDLTGDLPREVCSLRELQVLKVDCDAIGCECCIECSEDGKDTVTTSPTPAPATAAPTPCIDAVTVSSQCFFSAQDVVVALSSCNPQDDDWIGLYPASADINNLPNPDIWSWACGSRNCRESVTSNVITVNENLAGSNAWPLVEGAYRVVLARNSAQPYVAFAFSDEFSISGTC